MFLLICLAFILWIMFGKILVIFCESDFNISIFLKELKNDTENAYYSEFPHDCIGAICFIFWPIYLIVFIVKKYLIV